MDMSAEAVTVSTTQLHNALSLAYERYGRMVFNVCLRTLGNSDAAEDATQAVFLLLVKKSPLLRLDERLGGWLMRTAELVARKGRQAEFRRARRDREAVVIQRSAANERDDAELWRTVRPKLDAAIASLPEKYRLPIVMAYLAGQPQAEVARTLGLNEGTLRWRLSYAVERLREKLGGEKRYSVAALGLLLRQFASESTPSDKLLPSILSVAHKLSIAGRQAALSTSVKTYMDGGTQAMFWINAKWIISTAAGIALLMATALWASEPPSVRPAIGATATPPASTSGSGADTDAQAARTTIEAFCGGLEHDDAASINRQFTKEGLARTASFLSLWASATTPGTKRGFRLLRIRNVEGKDKKFRAYIDLDPAKAETEAEKETVKAISAESDYVLALTLVKEGAAWKIDALDGPPQDPHDIAEISKFSPVRACEKYAAAQELYHRKDHTGNGVLKYATTVAMLHTATEASSGLGQQTGLLDAAFALAEVGGAVNAIPLHGYCFKILKGQGAAVRASFLEPKLDGKHSYLDQNGNMTAGYALVAFPATYDSQAQLTYMVSCHGVIYRKDLGADTRTIAESMTEFNPDETWTVEK